MAQKLKIGLVYELSNQQKRSTEPINRQEKKQPRKRFVFPKVTFGLSALSDIARSFFISVLVLINLFLLVAAILWFGLILSFIPPGELLQMAGVGAETVEMTDIEQTDEIVNIPDQPSE